MVVDGVLEALRWGDAESAGGRWPWNRCATSQERAQNAPKSSVFPSKMQATCCVSCRVSRSRATQEAMRIASDVRIRRCQKQLEACGLRADLICFEIDFGMA